MIPARRNRIGPFDFGCNRVRPKWTVPIKWVLVVDPALAQSGFGPVDFGWPIYVSSLLMTVELLRYHVLGYS